MCLCCFLFVQENYPQVVEVSKFGSYYIVDLPDQVNLIYFLTMSSKLIKEKYLGYILIIYCVLLLFSVFPGKLP